MKQHNGFLAPLVITASLVTALAGSFALGSGSVTHTLAPSTALARPSLTQAAQPTDAAPAQSGSVTVLIYLNGSDLESEAGLGSSDIAEMLESGSGESVNVVIETLGTRQWQDLGIASDHTQRHVVESGSLELVDDSLGQLDTTSPDTLADFIAWGTATYPADRYMLLFWDHGAGPVYGFGYDEFQSDYAALTLDEIQHALARNSQVHFDMIGMDCCVMSSIETCKVLAPYCDYTVLSEDFEPGVGWSYARWLAALEQNPAMPTTELGQIIVDDMIADTSLDPENGDATLALIDESKVDALYDDWIDFAYTHEDDLVSNNYSQEVSWRGRPGPGLGDGHGEGQPGAGPWATDDSREHYGTDAYGYDGYDYGFGYDVHGHGYADGGYGYGFGGQGFGGHSYWNSDWDDDMSYVTMTDYFVTDIMEVASATGGTEANALSTALDDAIVHFGCTSGEQGMSGMSVTLPYGDAESYDQLKEVFTACGFDESYVGWLERFVDTPTQGKPDDGYTLF